MRGRKRPDSTPLKAGERYGKLTVVKYHDCVSYGYNTGKFTFKHKYECLCDCGKTSYPFKDTLIKGGATTCGCGRSGNRNRKRNVAYDCWSNAKRRAREKGLDFDLELEDIVFPELCPVFNTPMIRGEGAKTQDSPSLDRIDSSKGYTKDNVWVISWRANEMKNRYTYEELSALVKALGTIIDRT